MDQNKRECTSAAAIVPLDMSSATSGYKWARNLIGESGGFVYRLHGKTDAPDLYLKHGMDTVADDITDEMVRLGWLKSRMLAPHTEGFVRTERQAWLLMTALPGKTAYQVMTESPEACQSVVDILATFMRRLHSIPVDECPFNSKHDYRLALARKRIDSGLVDTDDFDDERETWTAEDVWNAMQSFLPLTPDLVVTHGDFSLDNFLISDRGEVGCIDVGRLGIADRYQDLAILWNCLEEFGKSLQSRFLQQYGCEHIDVEKLQFHLMLDELF
jgi:aminoglycoside 3'-phosphotransferase-1